MTDKPQPEAREFTMSQYASKDDMIGAMRKRIAELESELEAVGAGGVQALSAAPAGWKLVPVEPTNDMQKAADEWAAKGFDWPKAVYRAMLAASPTPQAELPIGELVVTKTKDGQIVSVTRQDDEGRILSVIATSDPVEQQAAPKAAPTRTALPEGWTACTIEFGNDGPEEVAYGPQRMMTRLSKWLGKYFAQVIAEAAPKAAPVEQNTVPASWLEQAFREGWAACRDAETIGEEAEDWAFGNSTANSRMIDAQQAAPKQEAQPTEIPQVIERMATDRYKVVPSHESMFHRWAVVAGSGTQQLYLGREVECQNMARKFAGAFLDGAFFAMQQPAPKQEAQEPVAWQSRTRPTWGGNTRPWSPWVPCTKEHAEDCWKTPLLNDWAYEARALYTAPQPAPDCHHRPPCDECAAIAAQRGNK